MECSVYLSSRAQGKVLGCAKSGPFGNRLVHLLSSFMAHTAPVPLKTARTVLARIWKSKASDQLSM